MSYFFRAFFAQHDCYYVEAKGPVLDIVGGKKVACSPEHSGLFGFGDGRLRRKVSHTGGRAEILARPGLDLDKDKRPITIDHDKIDFTGLTGEVSSERFETFAFEEFLAAFFTPSAERFFVRRRCALVRQQFSYQSSRIDLVIWIWCGRCAAGRA
jgi:hypothetical protein